MRILKFTACADPKKPDVKSQHTGTVCICSDPLQVNITKADGDNFTIVEIFHTDNDSNTFRCLETPDQIIKQLKVVH